MINSWVALFIPPESEVELPYPAAVAIVEVHLIPKEPHVWPALRNACMVSLGQSARHTARSHSCQDTVRELGGPPLEPRDRPTPNVIINQATATKQVHTWRNSPR